MDNTELKTPQATATLVTTPAPKTSNVTRITWFIMGCVFSAVLLWQVPSSANIAINVVDTVVTKTPEIVGGVAGWVSEKAATIGTE